MNLLVLLVEGFVLSWAFPLSAAEPIYDTPTSPREVSQPFPISTPTLLHFRASNVFGGSVQFDLKDGVVICRRDGVDRTSTMKSQRPSRQAWRNFVRSLNAAEAYRWVPDYTDAMVVDGGGWDIELIVGKAELYSKGINAFPRDGGLYLPARSGDTVHSFDAVWEALCKLVGEDSSRFPLK